MLNPGNFSQAVKTICGCTSGSGRDGQPCSVNSGPIPRCDRSDRSIATDLFSQKAQPFQARPSRPEGTKYEVKTAADLPGFAEFFEELEGKLPDVNMRNTDGHWVFCSESDLEEFLAALEAFDAVPPHAGVSPIDDESHRHVRDVEEKSLQYGHDIGSLEQEVADLRVANSRHAVENRTQKQEKDMAHRRDDALVIRFAQARSEDAIKRILQELAALWKQNHAQLVRKQILFND
jgi:hypothetical protein